MKSLNQQVQEVFDRVSYEDIKEFIIEHSKNNKEFRNLFLSNFPKLNRNKTREFYKKQIQLILNSISDGHGFIDWNDMHYFLQEIDTFITSAEKLLQVKNYKNAINICTALLEEMTKATQFCDDSNGEIGFIIEKSNELLFEIARKNLSSDIKTEFFNYCISAFDKKLFQGWDWHIEILRIAYVLVENEKKADDIIQCLNMLNGEYEKESAQLFILEIMQDYKEPKEVQKYINQHITNPSIREFVISDNIDNKKYEEAIQLCNDGIEQNKKKWPGLVNKWYKYLLKIAQAQKNTEKIIEYAKYLFIHDFNSEQDYYLILKQNIETTQWKEFVETIIEEIIKTNNWQNHNLIRKIYISEKWWDRLLLLLKQDDSLQNIESNEKYLKVDYSKELIQLYHKNLLIYVDKNVGRKYYQTACKYLRRMKKLGGKKLVVDLIEKFRKDYPQRRALLDELSRL